jgi:uncharacterized protein with FMN-binding domain
MNNKKTIISLGAVVVVAGGIFAVATINRANNAPMTTYSLPVNAIADATPVSSATDSTPSPQVPVVQAIPPKKATSQYKDGTYTATGTYDSPGGLDNVGVTLTLKNDAITSVSFTPMAHDGTSARYQTMFAGGFQSLVLGKNIARVHLDTVSGSSLTGGGFNDALAKIKAQAKA